MRLKDRSGAWLALALLALVWVAYGQVRGFAFINMDDPQYVTGNLHTQAGLGWSSLVWAFRTGATGNWHPLVWLSHMLDVSLFGMNPGPHHLVGVALHGANSVLVFLLLRRLTGAFWASAVVAALFALHPAHVESVAWVAERKDVLSTCLALLTLLAYEGWVRAPGPGKRAAVLGLYALGLTAKPMLVTLPLLMLLLDHWPLRRTAGSARERWLLLREKLPLLALAGASCVITFLVQRANGNVARIDVLPLAMRLGNALFAYVRYLGMLVWPAGLAVFYPYPAKAGLLAKALASAALLLAISFAAVRAGRRRPYLLVGWLWYLITLLPVIGIVQVGSQAMADRYTYLPYLGPFLALTWGAAEWLRGRAVRPWVQGLLAAAVLAPLLALSWRQVGHWRNSVTLFSHAARVTRNNPVAHQNLAAAYAEQGQFAEAVPEYQAASRLAPRSYRPHAALAAALQELGRNDEAIAECRRALACWPEDYRSAYQAGTLLVRARRLAEAAPFYRTFLALEAQRLAAEPDPGRERRRSQDARMTLGMILATIDQPEEACRWFREALLRDPDNPDASIYLAQALARSGRPGEGVALLRQGLAEHPRQPLRALYLGLALLETGERSQAAEAFRRTLELAPGNARARSELQALGPRFSRP